MKMTTFYSFLGDAYHFACINIHNVCDLQHSSVPSASAIQVFITESLLVSQQEPSHGIGLNIQKMNDTSTAYAEWIFFEEILKHNFQALPALCTDLLLATVVAFVRRSSATSPTAGGT